MMPRQVAVRACAALLWAAGAGAAQDTERPSERDTPQETASAPEDSEESPLTETRHSVLVGGRKLAYTATAGTITLTEEDGTEKANVFFVAYTLDGDGDEVLDDAPAGPAASRPITFTFNGGPGSSSVWLHLGAFGPRRVHPWSFSGVQNRYLNVARTLRGAMTRNPSLRVFVAGGYYDLATPYFAADFTIGHLRLDPALRGNVTVRYDEAGHMMYIHRPSAIRLKEDLRAFYAVAAGPR